MNAPTTTRNRGLSPIYPLVGGLGDDYLDGGTGKDTYYYRAGDGHDTLVDADNLGRILYIDAQGIEHLLTGGRLDEANPDLYRQLEQDRSRNCSLTPILITP